MCEVTVFLTERGIDGSRYCEQVCARSWDEAKAFAAASGAKLIGELKLRQCAGCGKQTDITDIVSRVPPLGDDEWPDEVE